MKKIVLIVTCFGFLVLWYAMPATGETFIGMVKSVKGNATIERNAESIPVTQGLELNKGDIVKTDQNSAVALVFSDDTLISMGPASKVAIDEYLFDPIKKRLAFVAHIIQGTISFLSGQIAKIAPESVQLTMPTATIGVRGTHILIKVE